MEYCLGIDPSLSGTGLCLTYRDGTHEVHRGTSKPAHGLSGRFLRYNQLTQWVIGKLPLGSPACIAIEGYSFASKGRGVSGIYEYGALVRQRLLGLFGTDSKIIEVAPMSLKLFAAGRSQADKTAMRMAVFKRWGAEFDDDDTCDAFALARMAAVLAGWHECDNAEQRRAVAGVLGEKIKKPKKARGAA